MLTYASPVIGLVLIRSFAFGLAASPREVPRDGWGGMAKLRRHGFWEGLMKHSKLWAASMGFAFAGMIAVGAQAAESVKYTIVNDTIPQSLTGVPGDAAAGKKAAVTQTKGNCLACHEMPIPEEQFHGKTGPSLMGIGSRQNAAELRMRLVDPKVINPDTMMPAFYKTEGLHRVMKKFEGQTILTAQEVEDIVAYLLTVK